MKETNRRLNKNPNIVVILADDMGYGDLSCYGSEKIHTPNMDSIAEEGIRFTDAHSSSAVCTPSRYGLLTGRYCWRTNLQRGVLGGFGKPLLEKNRETIASLLKKKGYDTAMFGKWHLGLNWKKTDGTLLRDSDKDSWNAGDSWNEDGMEVDYTQAVEGGPVDNGFDYWFGISGSLDMPPYAFIENKHTVGIPSEEKNPYEAQQRKGLMVPGWRDDIVDVEVTKKAVSYLKEREQNDPDNPFFLYIAPAAPHRPCVPPEFLKNSSDAGKRGDMVKLVDWLVGQVSQVLDDIDEKENTLFIVTSDNGGRLTNFDGKDYRHKTNGDLRGEKADIWEGGHREPLVMRWPGFIEPGRESEALVSLTDIFATVAKTVDASIPENAGEDSISFLHILKNEVEENERKDLIHHSYDGMFSLRRGDWKYIEGTGSGGFSEPSRYEPLPHQAKGQLYNIADDSRETLNLWLKKPEKVKQMSSLLNSYMKKGSSRNQLDVN